MYHSRLFGFFILLALLAGCSHTNPIVGTWSGSQTFPNGTVLNNTATFTSDGKITTTMSAGSGPYANRPVSSTGTYTADGTTLTETILTMSEPGRTKTIASPVAASYPYTLNGNTLTITFPNVPAPVVLTRQGSS